MENVFDGIFVCCPFFPRDVFDAGIISVTVILVPGRRVDDPPIITGKQDTLHQNLYLLPIIA